MFDRDLTMEYIEYYKKQLKKVRYIMANIYEDRFEAYNWSDKDTDKDKRETMKKYVEEEKRIEKILRLLDWDLYEWHTNDGLFQKPDNNDRLEFSIFDEQEFDYDEKEIHLRSELYCVGNYDSDDDCIVTDEGDKIKWDDVYKYRYVRY